MKNFGLYRVLTYILFTIGGFMALMLLTMILAALANPVLLLPVFLVACVVIYTYSSWRFLSKGIDAHQYCRPSLRDLIRVNGYGTLAFALLTGIQCATLLLKPALLNELIDQAMSMQQTSVEGLEGTLNKAMQFAIKFLLGYSIMLLVHVFISFRLLREHADAFEIPSDNQG
jgi:hypothetical protein